MLKFLNLDCMSESKIYPDSFEHFHRLQSLYRRMENNTDPAKEILLVLRSQSGDKEAFDELLKSVQTQLWRYISSLVGDREISADILQEVFLILYRKIGWLHNPELFRAWAYRIASRESFRYLKKEARWREHIRDH